MRFPFVSTTLVSILALSAAACGGEDDPIVTGNDGFVAPAVITEANVNDASVGPADWTCLNTATDDEPSSVEITLTGLVLNFTDDGDEVKEATVEVFEGVDYQNPLDTVGPTGIDGAYTLTLPAGNTRLGFKMVAEDYMDTFLLNQYFEPDVAAQTKNISMISIGTATALPALIGLQRTEGTGVLAGAMRDCQNREVSGAIATVSQTQGEVAHLDGAVTYYLDSGTNFPVRHEQQPSTDTTGLFAVFELPVTGASYVQVWGFVDEADIAMGDAGLTLLAELESPVVADTVITGSIEPLRTE